MIRFVFASGKVKEFDYKWEFLAPKLQLGGLRMFNPSKGLLIPLNSNTIAYIEDLDYEEEVIDYEEELPEEDDFEEEAETSETAPKLSVEERANAVLEDMKTKSSCSHPSHDIYYQEIMVGPKHNRKPSRRFFPVCTECGVRERYIKAEGLSEDQIKNAKLWDK